MHQRGAPQRENNAAAPSIGLVRFVIVPTSLQDSAVTLRQTLLAIALLASSAAAGAADPVKQVDIYVTPYYEASHVKGGAPKIAVAKQYDVLLASSRREDVAKARDEIARDNALLTPMTLMVLAIRLYDVGLRDDSVFWFYAAKDRYATLAVVADMKAPQLAQVEDATRNFAILAGPTINGYAFCDIARQQEIRAKAMQWVIDNPYKALFLPQVPARPGDREANLKKGVVEITAAATKEREYLAKPANVADLKAKRKENDADRKYCWK